MPFSAEAIRCLAHEQNEAGSHALGRLVDIVLRNSREERNGGRDLCEETLLELDKGWGEQRIDGALGTGHS